MAQLTPSFVLVHLFVCLQFLANYSGGSSACLPAESQKSVHPTPAGSLEDTLRGLDHLHNCTVRLYLLSGVHVISSGVAVSAASVALSSHPNNTDRPVVRCGDNMSHPGKSVNETEKVGFLTWKGAREVNISGVDFEGCPRIVQFIEVDSVSIRDCTFRLVDRCNYVIHGVCTTYIYTYIIRIIIYFYVYIISYHIILLKCTMCQGTLGHHCPMQHCDI